MDGLKKVASTISRQLFNGWLKECILLVVAVVVVYFLVKHVLHPRLFPKGEEVGMAVEMDVHLDRKLRLHISHVDVAVTLLGVVAVGYWGLVGKVAPYKTDRYFFCIYPLIVLCMVYLGYRTLMLLVRNPQRCTIALAVVALGITAMSYRTQTVNYLFLETNQRAQELAGYEEYPVIILSVQGTPEFADAQAMEFLHQKIGHIKLRRIAGRSALTVIITFAEYLGVPDQPVDNRIHYASSCSSLSRFSGFRHWSSSGRNRPSLRMSTSSNQISPPPYSGVWIWMRSQCTAEWLPLEALS